MAAESENVMEKRELMKEAIGTMNEWLAGNYTAPWADLIQRKVLAHAVDYESGYMVVEVARVSAGGLERTPKRYRITVAVENVRKP